MAGLSGRLSTVVKAKISKLLDRAEDPGETLEYSYQKQIELLQNVKKGLADVVTSKKRLQMQSGKLEQQVVKLDTQARQALAQGNEELARTALERRAAVQNELQGLDAQVTELEGQQEKMVDSEAKLKAKIEAFRSKKEVIKAQYSAAEAQVRISEAASGVGEEMADVGLAMQRAVDKTENMRARASAVEELEQAGSFDDLTQLGDGQDDIDKQLASLTTTSQVDSDLAKLKAELGTGDAPAAGQLGAGEGEPSKGAEGVIVRIAGEGQFQLPDDNLARLNELDNAAVTAVEQGDEGRFTELLAAMHDLVRGGAAVAGDELVASQVILPPRDTSLAEAQSEFSGDGLIPTERVGRRA